MIKEKKAKKSDSILEYGLKEIQISKFSLNEIKEVNLEEDEIYMNLELSGDIVDEKNLVQIETSIIMSKVISEKMKKIAELKVIYFYEISNLRDLRENGDTYLPKNLINTLNAISISTTRGILFTKFQGTKVQKFILPLIDPTKFKINNL